MHDFESISGSKYNFITNVALSFSTELCFYRIQTHVQATLFTLFEKQTSIYVIQHDSQILCGLPHRIFIRSNSMQINLSSSFPLRISMVDWMIKVAGNVKLITVILQHPHMLTIQPHTETCPSILVTSGAILITPSDFLGACIDHAHIIKCNTYQANTKVVQICGWKVHVFIFHVAKILLCSISSIQHQHEMPLEVHSWLCSPVFIRRQ